MTSLRFSGQCNVWGKTILGILFPRSWGLTLSRRERLRPNMFQVWLTKCFQRLLRQDLHDFAMYSANKEYSIRSSQKGFSAKPRNLVLSPRYTPTSSRIVEEPRLRTNITLPLRII